MDTTPYWIKSASLPGFTPPTADVAVDVAIIGGGITGLTAAYLLKKAGRRVAVIERGRCAHGDTGHTTAHLTCVTDVPLSDLVKNFGRDHAQAAWDAGMAAIAQIEAAVRTEAIACDFERVPGYLHAPFNEGQSDERSSLKQEASLARELGFDASHVNEVPFIALPGMRIEGQAKFHPLRYLAGLLRTLPGDGSYVFEDTDVEEIVGEPLSVRAAGRTIRCSNLVMATHTPHVGKAGLLQTTLLHTKLALYTSYVIGARIPKGLFPEGLFWDTGDPYHYLRIDAHNDTDYAIFGGEDHKTGQAADTTACFDRLRQTLEQIVPQATVIHHWSGQVIETNDGLPYIGEISPGQFVATGFSGNGMTFGTLGAMMACDAIVDRKNPWSELFDTGRTKIRGGAWDYVRENKDYPYYIVMDRLTAADVTSLGSVRRGEGRIVEIEGQTIAAWRSPEGALTLLSPVCTHMGCRVNWNEAEKNWDCPCHGSRFKPTGEVLAGPAESPLASARVERSKVES